LSRKYGFRFVTKDTLTIKAGLRTLLTRNDLAENKVSVLAGQGRKPLRDKKMVRELQATIQEIHDCIADACGEPVAETIEHFAPSSLAVYDPGAYESSLAKIIPTFSERIIEAVELAVSLRAGVWIKQSESLFEFMLRVSLKKGGMGSIISP
jgi:hypothetical protein